MDSISPHHARNYNPIPVLPRIKYGADSDPVEGY